MAEAKKIRVRYVRSEIGYDRRQRATLPDMLPSSFS